MPVAPNKQFRACMNLLYAEVSKKIEEANAKAALIRQAIIDHDLADYLTAGQQAALQQFVTDLDALAGSSVVAKLREDHKPTHRNRALIITGVNG